MTHDLLKALEARKDAIARDDAGWSQRETDVAEWAADTVFPQAIERWLQQIGEQVAQ